MQGIDKIWIDYISTCKINLLKQSLLIGHLIMSKWLHRNNKKAKYCVDLQDIFVSFRQPLFQSLSSGYQVSLRDDLNIIVWLIDLFPEVVNQYFNEHVENELFWLPNTWHKSCFPLVKFLLARCSSASISHDRWQVDSLEVEGNKVCDANQQIHT